MTAYYVYDRIKIIKPINQERLAEEIVAALPQIDPMFLFEFSGGNLYIQVPYGVSTDQIKAILDAHDASVPASKQVTYGSVSSGVEPCAGLAFSALTAAQKDALLYALLYNQGAIDPATQTIQAASAWLRR